MMNPHLKVSVGETLDVLHEVNGSEVWDRGLLQVWDSDGMIFQGGTFGVQTFIPAHRLVLVQEQIEGRRPTL